MTLASSSITLWASAAEVVDITPPSVTGRRGGGLAGVGLKHIDALFDIERAIIDLSIENRLRRRNTVYRFFKL
jgi:hypothetical protein